MARPSSISPEQGKALLEAYQRLGSKAAAAREIGVSEDAAGRYLADTAKAAAPTLAQQRTIVEHAGAGLWNTRSALEESYGRMLGLVMKLEDGITEQKGVYITQTPIATHVAAHKEIRETIKTSIEMMKLLVDMDEVRTFQQAVLEAIGEVDEPTRQRIIAKLKERRAVGLALTGD